MLFVDKWSEFQWLACNDF